MEGRSTSAFAGFTTGLPGTLAMARGTTGALRVAGFAAGTAGVLGAALTEIAAVFTTGVLTAGAGLLAVGVFCGGFATALDVGTAGLGAGVVAAVLELGLATGAAALIIGFAREASGLAGTRAGTLAAERAVASAFFVGTFRTGDEGACLGAGFVILPVPTLGAAFFASAFFFAAGLGEVLLFLTGLTGLDFFLTGDFMGRRDRSGAARGGVGPHGYDRKRRNPAQQWFY